MCLAVPGKIIERGEELATVDLQGNRVEISCVLTPEARLGDWVLVHAGFAISMVGEQDALETWGYLQACYGDEFARGAESDADVAPPREAPAP